MLRQGLVLTVIGLALSSLAIKGMNALFNGHSPDIGIMLLMAAGMMVISLIAVYAPAHRASRLDPMKVLRDE